MASLHFRRNQDTGLDFSFLGVALLVALLILLAYAIARVLFAISRWIERGWALFGVMVFTGYLLFDFNRLHQLDRFTNDSTWASAMRMSTAIFLDILNFLLHLFDLIRK